MPPVYHPARLKLLQPCVTFRGTVLADLHERDGDRHLWLAPDPGYEKFLNAANVYKGHKALVAEIVPACTSEPANETAAAACPASKLGTPVAGSHLEITGRWVEDLNHGSWREVHPVASLKVLPRVSLGYALPSPGDENADE